MASVAAQADMPPCAARIAAYYQLPVGALAAIHAVEGGRDDLTVRNDGGSVDRGRMQINSWWDDILAGYGITPSDLLHNGCTNVAVGAWILRQEVNRFQDWFKAFAAYNAGAGNLPAGYDYATRVISHWRDILRHRRVRAQPSKQMRPLDGR